MKPGTGVGEDRTLNGRDPDGRPRRDTSVAMYPHDTSRVLHRQVLVLVLVLLAAATLVVLQARPASGAGTVPTGFTQATVAGGLSSPTAMAVAPDGRLFVAEQGGTVRVIKDGVLQPTPFLRVRADSRGERGLLGLAFDPGFGVSNSYVYVYYTARTPNAHNRVSRFTASGDVAVAGSERQIFNLDNLGPAMNHNGGAIHFGSDRQLYVAVGDNGRQLEAQSLNSPFGKILRITRNGGIPKSNPYYGNPKVLGKDKAIWARGLRNPYSFAVQPGSGQMFINDVGLKKAEEINRGARGANYGWPRFEGYENSPRYTAPIFAYGHGISATSGCAITGGAFYNPPVGNFPAEYSGDYFFADFCSGWVRVRDAGTGSVAPFASDLQNPVDLQAGPDGSLYVLERGAGAVTSIRFGG